MKKEEGRRQDGLGRPVVRLAADELVERSEAGDVGDAVAGSAERDQRPDEHESRVRDSPARTCECNDPYTCLRRPNDLTPESRYIPSMPVHLDALVRAHHQAETVGGRAEIGIFGEAVHEHVWCGELDDGGGRGEAGVACEWILLDETGTTLR